MIEQNEIWKQIPACYGKYLASNFGKIMSVFAESQLGKVRETRTILKQGVNKNGYYIVKIALRVDGVLFKKTRKVHRLVCAAFHPNPENKPEVNHKNLNKTDLH